MRVDQSGNRRDPVGVDDLIRLLIQIVADRLNDAVFDEDRIRLPERTLQFANDERADVFDQ